MRLVESFGVAPKISDCVEVALPAGVAPLTIVNSDVGAVGSAASFESVKPVLGVPLPAVRRCWLVVAWVRSAGLLNDCPEGVVVSVPGLGVVSVGVGRFGGEVWGLWVE